MKISHFFLPHPETHKKAHLISTQAILIYIGLFILLQFGFKFYAQVNPGVLGVATAISQPDVISLTNAERAKQGLPALTEDPRLDAAAAAKAQNMFQENYWAHFAPSGKSPWDFISGSGYKFTYAGENLARNFNASADVVVAWMNSPSHRDNILNSHYQNIGIAVVDGVLNGERTTLVVQEFGKPYEAIAAAPLAQPAAVPVATLSPTPTSSGANPSPAVFVALVSPSPNATPVTRVQSAEVGAVVPASALQKFLLDPFSLTKTIGLALISLLIGLLLVDFVVIRRRHVVVLGSRHLPHLALLSLAATSLLTSHPGVIL